MKKLSLGLSALAVTAVAGACQPPAAIYAEPAVGVMTPEQVILPVTATTAVPVGTQVNATLDQRLSTAESNVNDTFTMTLQTPILNSDRETVIPAGARINGRITALRESYDVTTPAIIRLEFQQLRWADRTAPFTADVVETEVRREGRTAEDALRGAAVGAAAGAVLGTIIRRDIQGALAGAAIGAGAGTIISLGTADQDAVLDAGTTMTLRTTEPVPFQ